MAGATRSLLLLLLCCCCCLRPNLPLTARAHTELLAVAASARVGLTMWYRDPDATSRVTAEWRARPEWRAGLGTGMLQSFSLLCCAHAATQLRA